MIVYTYQIAKWRQLKGRGVPLIDTTVKSGDPRLAPTWEMVMRHKRGQWSDQEYTDAYYCMLDYWWFQDPEFWEDLMARPVVALGCYCPAHSFCHRYLLVEFLKRITEIDYRGELS